jgi:hypothetical protein
MKNRLKFNQIKPTKDWKISTEKIDIAKIEDLNRKNPSHFINITSVVVIKEDKLLLKNILTVQIEIHFTTRSVGKSFTSTLLELQLRTVI